MLLELPSFGLYFSLITRLNFPDENEYEASRRNVLSTLMTNFLKGKLEGVIKIFSFLINRIKDKIYSIKHKTLKF